MDQYTVCACVVFVQVCVFMCVCMCICACVVIKCLLEIYILLLVKKAVRV